MEPYTRNCYSADSHICLCKSNDIFCIRYSIIFPEFFVLNDEDNTRAREKGKAMRYPDQCGQYNSSNNYYIYSIDEDGETVKFKCDGRADTKIAEDEFKIWMKSSTSKVDPTFKRRVIKVVEHPKDFDKYNAKDKAIIEYIGEFQ